MGADLGDLTAALAGLDDLDGLDELHGLWEGALPQLARTLAPGDVRGAGGEEGNDEEDEDDDEGGKDSEEARWRAQDEDAYFARATYANCRFGVVQGGPTPKRARRGDGDKGGDDEEEEDDATAQRVYERMGRDAAFADV